MEKQSVQTLAAVLALSSATNSRHQTADGSYIFSRVNDQVGNLDLGYGKDRTGQYQRNLKDAEKLRKKKARKKATEKMRRKARSR